jgi:EAL domain-containing protein (putative c-di-GMP-specific phosphodiesterase class I)
MAEVTYNDAPENGAEDDGERMTTVSYLARQPIVDKEHRLVAYELLFRRTESCRSANVQNPLQAGVEVINNTLCLGTDWLLQGSQAFINLDEATLMSDFVTLLPPQHVVFEILETVKISPVLVARIQELRQQGYRFALDDFVCLPEYQPLMPLVDYIKLDVLEQPPDKTVEIIHHIRSFYKGKLLAEKVETREMFELCKAEGIEYFQGYYFARPENIANKTIKPTQMSVRVDEQGSGVRGHQADRGVLAARYRPHHPPAALRQFGQLQSGAADPQRAPGAGDHRHAIAVPLVVLAAGDGQRGADHAAACPHCRLPRTDLRAAGQAAA